MGFAWKQELTPEYNKFRRFIETEAQHSRMQAQAYIQNPDVDSVSCVDRKTKQVGKWKPPGGVIFLDGENFLEDFVGRRSGNRNRNPLIAHLFCGYMFIVEGLTTVEQQWDRIAEVRYRVQQLNQRYDTGFEVPTHIEEVGGAQPFMIHR